MPLYTDTISNFSCGADLTISRTMTDLPSGLHLNLARLVIKRDLGDALSDALVNKLVSVTLTVDGQITDPGTVSRVGAVTFYLSETDTTTLVEPKWFEIQCTTSDSKLYTSHRGVIRGELSTLIQTT